ncbi:hypothetical protein BC628DRAFT_568244 [Trametes gibbosa]|nr:hypothetical protein BC628DRAFT_568244 [Trametes gibbosa]
MGKRAHLHNDIRHTPACPLGKSCSGRGPCVMHIASHARACPASEGVRLVRRCQCSPGRDGLHISGHAELYPLVRRRLCSHDKQPLTRRDLADDPRVASFTRTSWPSRPASPYRKVCPRIRRHFHEGFSVRPRRLAPSPSPLWATCNGSHALCNRWHGQFHVEENNFLYAPRRSCSGRHRERPRSDYLDYHTRCLRKAGRLNDSVNEKLKHIFCLSFCLPLYSSGPFPCCCGLRPGLRRACAICSSQLSARPLRVHACRMPVQAWPALTVRSHTLLRLPIVGRAMFNSRMTHSRRICSHYSDPRANPVCPRCASLGAGEGREASGRPLRSCTRPRPNGALEHHVRTQYHMLAMCWLACETRVRAQLHSTHPGMGGFNLATLLGCMLCIGRTTLACVAFQLAKRERFIHSVALSAGSVPIALMRGATQSLSTRHGVCRHTARSGRAPASDFADRGPNYTLYRTKYTPPCCDPAGTQGLDGEHGILTPRL